MVKGRLGSLPETPWDYEEVLFGVDGSTISFAVNRSTEDYYGETRLIARRVERVEAVYDTEGPWPKIMFKYRNGTVNPDKLRKRALRILRGGAAKAVGCLAKRDYRSGRNYNRADERLSRSQKPGTMSSM